MSYVHESTTCVLVYHNAFVCQILDDRFYYYMGVRFEDFESLSSFLGPVEEHNQKIKKSGLPYYYINTKWRNIILRSDGWYRDFSCLSCVMYPPEFDFEIPYESLEVEDSLISRRYVS